MRKLIVRTDAGHGGGDPGACSGGKREKDATLAIDTRIANILQSHNVGVSRSRYKDEAIPLYLRNNRNNKYDAFISTHLNSFKESRANGIEVLYNNNHPKSKELAQKVLNRLWATGLFKVNRGLKYRNDLAVLRSSKTPSCLVEAGFISNPTDRSMIFSNYDKLAQASAFGVLDFLGVKAISKKPSKPTPAPEKVKEENKKEEFKVISKKYNIDGKNKNIETIEFEGVNYIPIRDAAALFGADVEYNVKTKEVKIVIKDNQYTINGRKSSLPSLNVNSERYVKLKNTVGVLNHTVEYNNKTKETTIK